KQPALLGLYARVPREKRLSSRPAQTAGDLSTGATDRALPGARFRTRAPEMSPLVRQNADRFCEVLRRLRGSG
ncbi:MAG: hypothetical protein ACR2HH_08690, partial [Chthoniobacterales bacterium]